MDLLFHNGGAVSGIGGYEQKTDNRSRYIDPNVNPDTVLLLPFDYGGSFRAETTHKENRAGRREPLSQSNDGADGSTHQPLWASIISKSVSSFYKNTIFRCSGLRQFRESLS